MTIRFFSLVRKPMVSIIVLIALLSFRVFGQEPKPTISVKGEAEMKLSADEILIFASIESFAKTAVDVCKDNRQKSQLLLEFLKSKSIDDALISSDLLSIDAIEPDPPKGKGYSKSQTNADPFSESAGEGSSLSQRRRVIGFTAYRNFTIVVKDVSRFEEIYQGIVEKGVNRVDKVEYHSSSERVHQEKLRQTAVRVAKERASAMAKELGATLSGVKSISNSTSRSSVSDSRGMSGPGSGGMGYGGDPFATNPGGGSDGQIKLQSSVEVVFYLGNTDLKE